jgi:glutathione synthase/RimK-type ligase-like ATP-grasp enzyme
MKTVGLLTGRERSFPEALINEISRRDEGITALYAQLDITKVDEPPPYDVLVDRISHEVTCYQPILKTAALRGTRVVNNPFWRIADDKAFGTALAKALGVPIPKTFILPSKQYGEDINGESLHNLRFPLDWEGMIADTGLPVFMKPHWGGGFRDVYKVETLEELWRTYDRTGRLTMIVQEAIEWTQYVRCIVIGKTNVLPLRWDPRLPHHERYVGARESMPPLDPDLEQKIVEHAQTLCRALGYDMNTCEFAVRDGVPYAIDFMNSAPDFEGKFLPPETFRWIVEQMADLCIRLAKVEPRPTYRWDSLLAGLK